MEDEVVTFWPDGTGTVEYMRPDFSDWVLFRWSRTRSSRVLLQPYRAFLEDDGKIVEGGEIPQNVEVEYGIELESRPLLDAPVPVLYLEDAGLFATHSGFGLLTTELRDDMRCPESPPEQEAH
ncbi:hypothetical protein [Nocardia sp. NPDC058633]|uniref:hypothetical protein n=1 Tax=Nocardia sp. NPDC058633 TaxID=3346568 RepID=UPI0036535F8A